MSGYIYWMFCALTDRAIQAFTNQLLSSNYLQSGKTVFFSHDIFPFTVQAASLESEMHRERWYTILNILAQGALRAAVCINMFLQVFKTCIMNPDSATSHTLTETASGYENRFPASSHSACWIPELIGNFNEFIIQRDAIMHNHMADCMPRCLVEQTNLSAIFTSIKLGVPSNFPHCY